VTSFTAWGGYGQACKMVMTFAGIRWQQGDDHAKRAKRIKVGPNLDAEDAFSTRPPEPKSIAFPKSMWNCTARFDMTLDSSHEELITDTGDDDPFAAMDSRSRQSISPPARKKRRCHSPVVVCTTHSWSLRAVNL